MTPHRRARLVSLLNPRSAIERVAALRYGHIASSQEGEDLLILRTLGESTVGTYVEVGANDPFRFSNSAMLYRRGWNGVHIDGDPTCCDRLRRWRSRAIVENAIISSSSSSHVFYTYDDTIYNTVDSELVAARRRRGLNPNGSFDVESRTLSTVLEECGVEEFDLLIVDTEGHDREVLSSLDWRRWRPQLVVAEILGVRGLDRIAEDPLVRDMAERGYELVSRLFESAVFQRSR